MREDSSIRRCTYYAAVQVPAYPPRDTLDSRFRRCHGAGQGRLCRWCCRPKDQYQRLPTKCIGRMWQSTSSIILLASFSDPICSSVVRWKSSGTLYELYVPLGRSLSFGLALVLFLLYHVCILRPSSRPCISTCTTQLPSLSFPICRTSCASGPYSSHNYSDRMSHVISSTHPICETSWRCDSTCSPRSRFFTYIYKHPYMSFCSMKKHK